MQRHESCSRDFPGQCEGCPEYREKRYDSLLPLISMAGFGMAFTSQYKNAVVKECKLYHRRRIEPLKLKKPRILR